MNNNEYNKANDALNRILSTNSGRETSKKMANATNENVINMINNMDKNEMISKLNSMGLGFISQKIKNTSKEDLIRMLKNNPQILNKLNNYIK